ncbi:hypothetical protein G4B88_021587 [Cannabis sativa]|uniref:Uncharacterized protein n=1 Tax=Cannabis sativa TaxID=3483 RepID=A0A7J6GIP9_CANSA|nr:hypothetical protein G4B88_021587 [Cannabis sativa]
MDPLIEPILPGEDFDNSMGEETHNQMATQVSLIKHQVEISIEQRTLVAKVQPVAGTSSLCVADVTSGSRDNIHEEVTAHATSQGTECDEALRTSTQIATPACTQVSSTPDAAISIRSCKMDRNWMSANRLSAEYKEGLFIMEPAPNDDDEWAQYEESFMPEEPNIEVEEPNIEVEEPNIEVEEPPPKQKNTRGRTKRLDITRLASEGKKLEIEYNNLGQQWGKAATDLVSRIGVWVRINIPLVNKKWPQIDKELKNRLWNDVKDVAPQLLEKPPRLYEDIIDETEWTEFVASRLTKEWGVTRKKAQASRAKNIYPHRSGRGGARMVELQMEKELGHQLVKIDRADLWKRLRTNSKGELEGPAVEVAQRITH